MRADRARYRVGQFARALVPWTSTRDRALTAAVLSPAQCAAFRSLAAADQRHATRVLRRLLAEGVRDPDLLVAALLHDLGKVEPGGAGRVRLAHRVAKVILARAWPRAWDHLSARPRRGPAMGCYLLRHHPALGAAWAARLGCTPRTCALIAAHQGGQVAASEQGALCRLRRADDQA